MPALDQELLGYLLAAAIRLSGLPGTPAEALPPVITLPPGSLSERACRGHRTADCERIVSLFDPDDYVIYIRDTLDFEDDADNSWLVHELVHVLQWNRDGSAIFEGCERALGAEREAYRVQNAYLKREGLLMRVGQVLNFTNCGDPRRAFFAREPGGGVSRSEPPEGVPRNPAPATGEGGHRLPAGTTGRSGLRRAR